MGSMLAGLGSTDCKVEPNKPVSKLCGRLTTSVQFSQLPNRACRDFPRPTFTAFQGFPASKRSNVSNTSVATVVESACVGGG
jgi:hypothetical protein